MSSGHDVSEHQLDTLGLQLLYMFVIENPSFVVDKTSLLLPICNKNRGENRLKIG